MKTLTFVLSFLITLTVYSNQFTQKKNGEFITVSGNVSDVKAHSFMLNTAKNSILVEMDDYYWDADGYKLKQGDRVVVYGRIDHDFLERKKIEAGSVFVKNLNTFFFANDADEESAPKPSITYTIVDPLPEYTQADVMGKVVKVDEKDKEFVVDTGLRKITVNTNKLLVNPLDDKGYVQIDKGDFVKVSGFVDKPFFGKKELDATYVQII